ncbi:MAG: penicillin-binding transpeptidase domain-containing protein, partial [Candidatus Cloacimonas sp.]
MFSKKSLTILYLTLLAPFILILIFLFRFQILEGSKYSRIAEYNFVRVQTIFPTRGEIFDRHYRPIAVNYPSTNLYILPARIVNIANVASFISDHLPITEEEVRELVHKNRFKNYQEILLFHNLSYEKVVEISEQLDKYPSLYFKTENYRQYTIENHFTGYVNRISREEYDKLKETDYTRNCLIGKTGLEKQYEPYLRGKTGHRIIQVDANGRSFNLFTENLDEEAVNGSDMILSVDLELQEYIESIFPEGYNGAVLAMNPQNGEILSYVSRPNYDINRFATGISQEYWTKLVEDSNHPMLDRVATATYPPASLFKTMFAIVALENHTIDPAEKPVYCTGSYKFGNRTFNCWLERGHGRLDMAEAIKHSCNVYFYEVSQMLELDKIADFMYSNNILARTNIDLPSERSGFYPTTEWYAKQHGTKALIPGHKINLSIGQGEVLMTPLQVGVFYSAIANGGRLVRPHFF